jgi:hypothetical protein
VARVRELTIPTERPLLVGEDSAKFADRGCHVVSVTDLHGRIFGFLDRDNDDTCIRIENTCLLVSIFARMVLKLLLI